MIGGLVIAEGFEDYFLQIMYKDTKNKIKKREVTRDNWKLQT